MAKKIQGYVKIEVPAGKAAPSGSLGPALGQQGVNIMEFCKAFNAVTANDDPGSPIPVIITVYADRSFTFTKKTSPVSYFLKKAANLKKGSGETGKTAPIASVSKQQIEEIAEKKMKDLNAYDLAAACRMIEGTARSMGIDIVE